MNIKKILLILILNLSVVIPTPHAQEQNNRIILKVGKHSEFIRFVFISQEERVINAISANLTKEKKIQISIPSDKLIEYNGKLIKERESTKDFTIQKIESDIFIEVPTLKNIKFLKLSSPYRFVLDVYINQGPTVENKTKGEVLFMIDPGHGGKDRGFIGKDISEKDLTLSISKEIATKLAQRGIKTALTRAFDEDLSLKRRVKISSKASYLLSIHLSKNDVFRIYYRKDKSSAQAKESAQLENLVKILRNKIERNFSLPLYIETTPIYLLKHSNSPTILIELPNKTIINDKKYNSKIADLIVESISEFVKTGVK